MRRGGLAALSVAAIMAFCASTASARSEMISSFDGTQIKVNFFPTDATAGGAKAPTVLFGPGWSSPGATNPDAQTDTTIGAIGVGTLRAAGYNVLTWDPRGFGDSGGTVTVDSPDAEALDVKELVSYVARQPEAELDRKGDPRVGMTGASYGGGIQLSAAALDKRIDVIAPDIAWHSLTTALYKDATFKAGWGTLLYTLGKAMGTLDPHIDSAFLAGQSTGHISDDDAAWFASRGPGDLLKKIKIPTLLLQGTVDTLFTLNEAIANYKILHHNGVPLKMLWFCGGHGSCLTNAGDPTRIDRATIAWLDRYLAQDRSVKTGPGFDWINQDGERFSSKSYPPQKLSTIKINKDGSLPIMQAGGSGPSGSGPGAVGAIAGITNGTRATNAANVAVPASNKTQQIVGAPKLSLTYSGTASDTDVRVFAQLVDDDTDVVLGNQVTPIPLTLDGATHSIKRKLEAVAYSLRPGSDATLQLVASASNYGPQRATGDVVFSKIALKLPVVKAKPSKR